MNLGVCKRKKYPYKKLMFLGTEGERESKGKRVRERQRERECVRER